MKLFNIIFPLLAIAAGVFAQQPDDVLATATGHTVRLRDLSAQTQKDVADLQGNVAKTRTNLLDEMIFQRVMDAEAAARGITSGKLIADSKANIPAPTEAEIKKVFTTQHDAFGTKTLDEVRKPIIDFLRRQAEQTALINLFDRLKSKYKYSAGKNVNAVGLGTSDAVATLNGQPITAGEFETFARIPLSDVKGDVGEAIANDIHETLYNLLIADEARSLGIDSGGLIAREITDKMKDFSEAERLVLTNDLAKRLFTKYQVKILYTPPEAPVQTISLGNSPATGPANAAVTIVMFSDFQCSACSATHPVLKKAMEAYPGKIRFVVRNFPLESVHAHAWRAALAAAAANAQGKFFEYTEVLYTHQDALDDASLIKYAAGLGLNVKQFELDFNSEKTAAWVRKDMADGQSYGIRATPTIYVNGRSVRSLSVEGFRAAIDKALENK